jgi:hypothetical protein
MAPKTINKTAEPTFDPDKARAAFVAIEPAAKDVPADQLATGNLNIIAVAIAAVGVSSRCTDPALYARFQSLPAGEFDMRNLDGLSNLAWGTWHAGNLAQSIKAQKSAAKLPADLVHLALQVESRLQRCCEYYFSDDPALSIELARLRPGVDYPDLAADLAGYARIYEAKLDVVSKDTKFFRPTDREDALRISAQIISHLGEGVTAEVTSASDAAVRCFTLLSRSYEEVASAGRWLQRRDPNVETFFPSLYAVARRAPSRKQPEPAATPTNP